MKIWKCDYILSPGIERGKLVRRKPKRFAPRCLSLNVRWDFPDIGCIVYCVLWYEEHHDVSNHRRANGLLLTFSSIQVTFPPSRWRGDFCQKCWLSPPSRWWGWQTARPAWPRNRSTTTRWMWPFVKLSYSDLFDDTNYRWKGRYSWSTTAQRSL